MYCVMCGMRYAACGVWFAAFCLALGRASASARRGRDLLVHVDNLGRVALVGRLGGGGVSHQFGTYYLLLVFVILFEFAGQCLEPLLTTCIQMETVGKKKKKKEKSMLREIADIQSLFIKALKSFHHFNFIQVLK